MESKVKQDKPAEEHILDIGESPLEVADLMNDSPRRFAAILVTPAQLLLYFILIFPLTVVLYLSLTSYSPLTSQGRNWWYAADWWTWFSNYADLIQDPGFLKSISRTLLIVGISVPLEFLIGLGLAYLFVQKFPLKSVFQTAYLVPMMIVPAVAGYMWFMLLQGNGPINGILSIITGNNVSVPWLTQPRVAIISVIIAEVWQWTPLMFLILLSGLSALPEDQMRAASMLGASGWQKFRWVTLPMLRPVIIIALIIRTMEAIKLFDMPFLLTGGGPAQATETLSIYLYKLGFRSYQWAVVGASAVVIVVVVTILATYALKPLQPEE